MRGALSGLNQALGHRLQGPEEVLEVRACLRMSLAGQSRHLRR